MKIAFKEKYLERLAADATFTSGFDKVIVRAYRKRLQSILAAKDERDIRAIKGSHFEKLQPPREHQYSVRLTEKWRLIIEIEKQDDAKQIMIAAIEDDH